MAAYLVPGRFEGENMTHPLDIEAIDDDDRLIDRVADRDETARRLLEQDAKR